MAREEEQEQHDGCHLEQIVLYMQFFPADQVEHIIYEYAHDKIQDPRKRIYVK